MNDIVRFEKTLRDKRNKILDDPFIMTYVDPLLRKMREQVLLALIQPYQRIRLSFISDELRMPLPEVESLLVDMILDRRVQGKIDQTRGFLITSSVSGAESAAVDAWASSLESLLPSLVASVH
jgi:COP9 signalosome complex subunit 2